jgi:hypothetical protein
VFSSVVVQSDEEFHVYVRKAVHTYQTQTISRYIDAKFVNTNFALKTGRQIVPISDLLKEKYFQILILFSFSETQYKNSRTQILMH